jgi:hypothetical protein
MRVSLLSILTMIVLLACVGCQSKNDAINVVKGYIPIVSLLANQQYYHGKHIATAGHFILDDRGRPVLYLDEQAANRGFPADSCCLRIDPAQWPMVLLLTNQPVVVFGAYNANDRGDGSVHSGTIAEVETMFPLRRSGTNDSAGIRGSQAATGKTKQWIMPH